MRTRHRIALALSLLGLALIAAGQLHQSAEEAAEGTAVIPEPSSGTGADEEMARWLLRDGWRHLRHHRRRAAEEAAALARFFGAAEGAIALEEAIAIRTRGLARILLQEAADAEAAGDIRRARRIRQAHDVPFSTPATSGPGGEGQEEMSRAISPSDPRTAALVEEARLHAERNEAEQARLALIEAADRQPADERIARLLEEVGRQTQAAPSGDVASVERSYEEGLQLKREGDLAGARRALDRAVEGMRALAAAPPFSAALGEARQSVIDELRKRFSHRLSELRRLLAAASAMPAPRAVEQLAEARRSIEEIADALLDEADVMRLRTGIDAALRSAASRWIAAARTAETHSGCGAARPMYRAVIAAVGESWPALAQEATRGVGRCPDAVRTGGR